MRTINRMTNELGLVETSKVGRIEMWNRARTVPNGFSLEVFRNDKHLTSITPLTPEGRLNLEVLATGNIVLKVNLGYRSMTMSRQMNTPDGFRRDYEIDLLLHVSQPTLFAIQYRQQSDPIFLAQKEIERILEIYTYQRAHDSLSPAQLRELAVREFSPATQRRCGVTIDEVHRVYLGLDPRHAQILETRQQTMVEVAQLDEVAYREARQLENQIPLEERRDEIEMRHARRLAAHNREEGELQGQHERRQIIQDTYVRGMGASIEDDFRRGYRPDEVWEQHPELRSTFGAPAQPQQIEGPAPGIERRLLPEGGNRQNTGADTPGLRVKGRRQVSEERNNVSEGEARTLPAQGSGTVSGMTVKAKRGPQDWVQADQSAETVPQPASITTNATVYTPHLGATLMRLSDEQRRLLEPGISITFMIQTIDPDGPAQKGQIIPGDYLVSINDQPVPDAQPLFAILDACGTNVTVTVRVLRAGQLIDLENIRI